jgi:hypothetical protein
MTVTAQPDAAADQVVAAFEQMHAGDGHETTDSAARGRQLRREHDRADRVLRALGGTA